MKIPKNEVFLFLQALQYFTRFPVPKSVDNHPFDVVKFCRYFPLVGILVGIIGAGVFSISYLVFKDTIIASFLSLGATILVTGAFHEDGLTDVVDGFGGGSTKIRILEIMKDSRVGAFGVIALILALGLKIYVLSLLAKLILKETSQSFILFGLVIVSAHSISRAMPVFFLRWMENARDDSFSKTKSSSAKISLGGLILATLTSLLPLFLLITVFDLPTHFLLCMLPCFFLTFYLAFYFKKWINGYTGDCLGATQQLNEITFYLAILALWNYTL
jgi:adenosylcobinamide-GDP ribazoletransferase